MDMMGLQAEKAGLTSNLVFSAIILCIPIPTPSITPINTAHPIAEFLVALRPPRIASAPPVKNPAITIRERNFSLFLKFQRWLQEAHVLPQVARICSPSPMGHANRHDYWAYSLALYGSSFFRMPLTVQSNIENSPPQTPKLPPSTGARAFIAVTAPILRSPYGLFLNPFTPCQTAPPIPPMQKAPPKSLEYRQLRFWILMTARGYLSVTHGHGSRE